MPNEELNESERIEELLRKAPRPRMPEGLSERLRQQICPPRPKPASARAGWSLALPRSWVPALSFSIVLLLSAAIIGATSMQISKLSQANESLRAENAQLEGLRQDNARLQKLGVAFYELDRMRKENQELAELRVEMERSQAALAQARDLAAENQRLQAEIAGLGRLVEPAYLDEEMLTEARERTERAKEQAEKIKCVHNLKTIGLAARIWATTKQDQRQGGFNQWPVDFASMANELSTPRILICPSDPAREPAADWSRFTPGHTSYKMLSPGISEIHHDSVYVECPIHKNVALTDGSVHQLRTSQVVVLLDGRWVVRTRAGREGE
jgi:hypothetical protein